jgi:protocatechuate 3,4-dioxygenase beta subunit
MPTGGRSSVIATKSGYARNETTATATAQPIEIRLRRGAAISGRVVDEIGEPVIGARVSAGVVSGPPRKITTAATTDTDDRGEYRLASLPSGTFAVAAVTAGTRPEAEDVRLEPGDDRSGMDLVVPTSRSANQPFSVVIPAGVSPLNRAPGPAARATGRVRGRIVSSDGTAVPYAQVVLTSLHLEPRVVNADGTGRFEFLELPGGTFRLGASKPGFFPVSVREPSAPSVDLAEDGTREGVEIRLVRWGTLTGRVFDEYGDPLQAVSIQLLHVRYEAGRRRLVSVGNARLTDDFGAYRLFGLMPGQYIVSAAIGDVSSDDVPGYARTYFPGTPAPAEAQFVSVGPGQELAGIDMTLSRTPTARVAGRMFNSAGEPTAGGTLLLMPSQRSLSATSVPVGARISRDGTFAFANVAPGQYVIQAYRGRSNPWTEGEFGSLAVGVGGADMVELVLQTSSGSSIAGRFSFDTFDPSKQPLLSGLELSPIPVDADLSPQNNFARANIHADGTFEIAGISGPRRLQLLRTAPGWALKEIRVNGVDITDITDRALPFGRKDQSLTGVEVVLTDRVSALVGTIRDQNARPSPGASLIVFSADRARWYPTSRFVRKTAAAADGAFSLTGLPAGIYYAAAVGQLPLEGEDAWQDPEFLDTLVLQASTVTIVEGQPLSLSIRVAVDTRR